MGMFDGLKNEGLEKTQDRLGGFQIHDTDAYDSTIKMAYGIQSAQGAKGVVLEVDLGNGATYRETIYVTNRAGENFYLNPADKTKKVGLPGYVTMNDICLASTETPLDAQVTEEKIVKIWDNDAKAEMPKSVPVLTGLLGKPVTLGLLKVLENKSVKNETTGAYEPIADTREANQIDKVFHTATKLTMVEAEHGNPATFYEKWVAKNKGNVSDKRKIKDGASAGAPRGGSAGAPTAGGAPAGKAKSLFS